MIQLIYYIVLDIQIMYLKYQPKLELFLSYNVSCLMHISISYIPNSFNVTCKPLNRLPVYHFAHSICSHN